jgi:hypothetical protein
MVQPTKAYKTNVSPRSLVAGLLPKREARKRLTNLDALVSFGYGTQRQLMSHLLTRSILLFLVEEHRPSREERGKE